MHDSGTTILKRDALGRIGYLLEQREALLDEFEAQRAEGGGVCPDRGDLLCHVCQLDAKAQACAQEVDRLQQEKKVLRLKIDALSRKGTNPVKPKPTGL